MNRSLIVATLLLAMSPGMSYAQNGAFEQDLDREIDQISAARTNPQAAYAQTAPAGATIAPQGSTNGQPIYILNQATPTSTAQVQQAQVQKQPQVEIIGSPVAKSRAEQIRDARQQAEVETENRIVEKLEQSRIEDEKRRASMLFGGAFEQQSAPQPVQQVVPVQAAPVAVAAPVVVDNSLKEETVRSVVREELQTAMKKPEPTIPIETRYFGAIVGIGDYPDVKNVRGNYALGASFGNIYDNSMVVEGTFLYSDYTVADFQTNPFDPYCNCYGPKMIDVHQYSGSMAVKYMFLDGLIRPIAGGLVQYSYRTYGWSKDNFGYPVKSDEVNSHAIDVGVVAGADIAFNNRFSLGFDFRYMWNVASRVNSQPYWFTQYPYFGTPMEKLQYYTMSLVGRVNF
ncbi:MAG: hypothetical protein KF802_15205 [Bdellovibrionaceae bacterium]|nr:hypothetical protein [Pseudobdellovibrionaceae bacterium]MBX3033433.1 hypothetical protein [Pseudobdellovibrionaceae bacterium]